MSTQYEDYVSQFTGEQIDQRLGQIPGILNLVEEIQESIGVVQQGLAEVVDVTESTEVST